MARRQLGPFSSYNSLFSASAFPAHQENFQQALPNFNPTPIEDLGTFSFDSAIAPGISGSTSNRDRRKSQNAQETVKHRRTRSGCYTCRNRRVKCDEKHPICERCRKGNRECNYPSKTKTQKAPRGSIKSKNAPQESESPSDAYESEEKDQLQTIADEDDEVEPPSATSTTAPGQVKLEEGHREASEPPSLSFDKSTSPSTEGSSSIAHENVRTRKDVFRTKQQNAELGSVDQTLSIPLKESTNLLDFYRKNITCHHYGWRLDADGFFHGEFLEIASTYEPLLYAVTGFAAYHHTLNNPNGKLSDFLQFYHTSVSLLRRSLDETEKHKEATLLTILQLATFEEYLGDWLNLIGHQKAALAILKSFYTPDSIQETPTLRRILTWYYQFDITVGFLSGNGVVLEREWIAKCHQAFVREKENNPTSLTAKMEEYINHHRLLAADVAILFAKRTKAKKGEIQQGEQEFWVDCNTLAQRIRHFESFRDPALTTSLGDEQEILKWLSQGQDNTRNPTSRRPFYTGDLYPMNFAFIDMCALKIMFKHKLAQLEGKTPPTECRREAFKAAQMFEAIQLCPDSQPGALLAMHQCLAMTCLFLPKNEETIMWLRRKFVSIEAKGYILPPTLRFQMSRLWGVDVRDWWLPNNEGFPPILRATREFVQARMGEPKDQFSQDLQEINGIFSSFNIDNPSPVGDMAINEDSDDTTLRLAPAEIDGVGMQQMLLDDQMNMNHDSPPQYLQNLARVQSGWTR